MNTSNKNRPQPAPSWTRIPDGTRVRHRHEGHDGIIDGLTELATGPGRNPDGKTQYRMNIGTQARQLVVEDDLCILLDADNLVIMVRQKEPYRRSVTAQLHGYLAANRFIRAA